MPGTKLGFKFGGTTPDNSTDLGETFVRRDYFERKSLDVVYASGQVGFGTYNPGDTFVTAYKVNGADVGTGLNTANYGTITDTVINSDSDWIDVSAVQQTAAAITRTGTLWVWGGNREYSLGLGDQTNRNTPTQVGSGTDWKRLFDGFSKSWQEATVSYGSGSAAATMAQKQDGTIWGWGKGWFPNSNSEQTLTAPTQVNSDTDWKEICQYNRSGGFALKTDGRLFAWGKQDNGWLGNGVVLSSAITMTQVGTSTWKSLPLYTDEAYASAALNEDGQVYWWGRQLPSYYWGTTPLFYQSTPIVSGLGNIPSDAAKLFGRPNELILLDSAGGCYGWKWNSYNPDGRSFRKLTDIPIRDMVWGQYIIYLLSWEGDVYKIENDGYSFDQAYLTMVSDGVKKYSKITHGTSTLFAI